MRSIIIATCLATYTAISLGSQLTARLLRMPARGQQSFVNAAQQRVDQGDAFAYYEALFERYDDKKQQEAARDDAQDGLVIDFEVEVEDEDEDQEWTFAQTEEASLIEAAQDDEFTGYTSGTGKYIDIKSADWNAREFFIWLYKEDNDNYQYLDSKNKLYTYGDKTWNYDKYLAYLYRNYGYTDAKTGKWVKYGDKGFIWQDYYTWFYDKTYSYTRKSDGKKVKYSDDDFSMAEYEASQ